MKKYLLVLYLIIFVTCDDYDKYEEDKQKCDTAGADKQKCLSVNSTSLYYYCCYYYSKTNEFEAECKILDKKHILNISLLKLMLLKEKKLDSNAIILLGMEVIQLLKPKKYLMQI